MRGQCTNVYRRFAFVLLVGCVWTRLVAFSLGGMQLRARQAYFLPLDRILTLSHPAHSEKDHPSEVTMLNFKILRCRLDLDCQLH